MSDHIDLQFRPKTYFKPTPLQQFLLSKVKGTLLRKKLAGLFQAGRYEEAQEFLADTAFSEADRKALESIHPMFMGGNYIPDTEDGEVEIARISIQSTTHDVTCVYARPDDGEIRYRVVDEYGGSTLRHPSETTTTAPMTLAELADFFLTAWPLLELLEMFYEGDVNSALAFFSGDSDFYPQFDTLCRQRVREQFPKPEPGDRCPFCEQFNALGAGSRCEHIAAWVAGGRIEAAGVGVAFDAALRALAAVAGSASEASPVRAMLEAQAQRGPVREAVLEAAALSLDEALETLARGQSGEGWAMSDAPDGDGYGVFVPDPADVERLTAECRDILKSCAFTIQTATVLEEHLEARRPDASVRWHLVASGFWCQDMFHSGYVAYYIANPAPGCWVMDLRSRNAVLDDVTEEDVAEGRLNDDQIQAMWGQTLEQAQSFEYKHIVAWADNVEPDCTAAEMAAVLYRAVCEAGGEDISERDDSDGLLEAW